MFRVRILLPALACCGALLTPAGVSALPWTGAGAARSAETAETLVEKAWHSGLPHRRVVGSRVYGGTCPPRGCPLWTQRDIVPDPNTGRYKYYASPPDPVYRRSFERRRYGSF